jgi:glycine/D-amino acid oxidase-like deaminating enzyme
MLYTSRNRQRKEFDIVMQSPAWPPSTPSPEVIVVGGGVTGSSIAWRLAESGRRVLLLEKRGICSGASGRNAGMTGAGSSMHAHSRAGRAVYALTTANLALMKQIPIELGIDFSLRLPGSMDVITTEEQYRHLQAAVAAEQEAGIEVELIDGPAARSIMPALSPDILGAAYVEDRGHIWPFALVNGMADAAARFGAEIRCGLTVDGLLKAGDRVTGVVANGESIAAGEVVLATNAWTPQLLPDLPPGALVPARGQILVTQPLPPLLACPFGTNFDKEYGRQTPTGQVLCGGYRRLDVNEGLGTYAEEVTLPVQRGIARCLVDLFPTLRGKTRIVRSWAGIMGFTADGLPLIGRYEQTPGLTVAAGFNGGGFSWGPIVGKVVARLLNGEEVGFDLEPFRPARFADGDVSWANPFTAGEKSNPTPQLAI